MGRFTVIPQNTFEELQLDAGVLLSSFDPSTATVSDSAIICATTGGINITCVPTFSDLGEDVDNCPNNTKELKHLDGWDCGMSFTALGVGPAAIKFALGCADIDGSDATKIIPRRDLAQSDFADIWWVGDRADGGMVAIRLINALSTGGFSVQTTKSGKGNVSVEITGHVSINAQNVVPMEFYSAAGSSVYYVTQRLTNVTSSYGQSTVAQNGSLTVTLTPASNHTLANVIVLMGDVDVTSTKYNSGTHKVTIASVTGDVEIIATANGT